MTETNIDDTAAVTEPIAPPAQAQPAAATEPIAPPAQEQPANEDALERAKGTLIHAVETVMNKVTETLSSIGGRK